ncbi:MAG: beta-lactamase family protein [Bacteroidetes bacterium]|nr:beta-lactamase family protein [Bacteroidota bacterium]
MKKIGILLLIIGYSVIAHGQKISRERIKPLSQDTLIKFMQQTMHDFEIPGLAVSIFTKDTVLNTEVSGVRIIHTVDSIKLNDRFHLGSCGKAMTGLLQVNWLKRLDYMGYKNI